MSESFKAFQEYWIVNINQSKTDKQQCRNGIELMEGPFSSLKEVTATANKWQTLLEGDCIVRASFSVVKRLAVKPKVQESKATAKPAPKGKSVSATKNIVSKTVFKAASTPTVKIVDTKKPVSKTATKATPKAVKAAQKTATVKTAQKAVPPAKKALPKKVR